MKKTIKDVKKIIVKLKSIDKKFPTEIKKANKKICDDKFDKIFLKPSKLKGEEILLIDIDHPKNGLLASSEKLKDECNDPKFVKKVTTKFNSIQSKKKNQILKNKKADCERKFNNLFKYPSTLKGVALEKLNTKSLSGSSEKLKTDCTTVKGFTNKVNKKFKGIKTKQDKLLKKSKKKR